jgi:hypothetical protein
MGYGRHRLFRNLIESLAVGAAIALVGLGLPAWNDAVPAAQAVAADRAYPVGAGGTVVPPPNASLDVTKTAPGPHQGTALFVVGPVRYAIVVAPFTGMLGDAAARLRHKITATRGYQVAGGEKDIQTVHGVAGRQGMYSSPGRDGRYAVFVANGLVVEITVAGDIDLRGVLPSIESSVRSLAFGSRS